MLKLASGTVCGFLIRFVLVALCQAMPWNVKESGARGDKEANDTIAIQRAIDQCAEAGGGTVYVPTGDYRCGQLQLRSNVTLHLEAGATLWVSAAKEDYREGNRFLFAKGQSHITLEGRGVIHGTGEEDLQRKRGDTRPRPDWPVGILEFVGCHDVTIRDVTVRYSDSWTFDLERCENVVIDGVSILNNYYRVNADGIDPVSCRRVRISNCHIVAGDDPIVCKSRAGYPCEDVLVTNCVLETVATAIKIGTESHEAFRNIRVSNCVIRNSGVGIGVFIKDGATAERISFTNCTIETIRQPELLRDSVAQASFPVFMDIEKRHPESRIGKIRDVTFADIDILSDRGVLIQGMERSRIKNLTLRNITQRVDRAFDYSQRRKRVGGTTSETEDRRRTIYARQPAYVTLANVEGLTVDGLRVFIPSAVFAQHNRSALSLHQVSRAVVRDVRRTPGGADVDVPVVMMENCQDSLLAQCFASPDTGVFLGLAGAETANIALKGNDLTGAREGAHVGSDVPQRAIRD